MLYTSSSDLGGTMQNHAYNDEHCIQSRRLTMPSKKSNQGANFGQRMADQ